MKTAGEMAKLTREISERLSVLTYEEGLRVEAYLQEIENAIREEIDKDASTSTVFPMKTGANFYDSDSKIIRAVEAKLLELGYEVSRREVFSGQMYISIHWGM